LSDALDQYAGGRAALEPAAAHSPCSGVDAVAAPHTDQPTPATQRLYGQRTLLNEISVYGIYGHRVPRQ